MNNKGNIEDLFRSGLEGHTEIPSSNVWSGINKQMSGPRMESMYQKAFKGFKINPTEQVWKRIAAAMWFSKFLKFSPFTFNVYYSAVILTTIVGSVVSLSNYQNNEFVAFPHELYEAAKIKTIETIENKEFEEYMSLRNDNPEFFELSNENENNGPDLIALNNVTPPNIIINDNSNNNITPVDLNENTTNQTDVTNPENVLEENTTETTIDNNTIEEITEATSDNNVDEENNTELISDEGILIEEPLDITIDNNDTESLDIQLEKLASLGYYSLSYSPTSSEIADAVLSGIPVLEVIKRDTVGEDYKGDPIVVEKSFFTVDLYYSPYKHNYGTSLLNTELNSEHNFYNENINPNLSYSTGLGFAYTYKNLRFESGIGYHRINESLSKEVTKYDTFTDSYFDFNTNDIWEVNTTMILDLDEYLQGNIVYIQHIDSTLTQTIDSTEVFFNDSTLVTKYLNASNSYHFVDVPLVAGYEFKINKLSITPKAGVISSMLVNRSGSYYDILEDKISDPISAPNTKFLFDYYGAVNLQYKFSKYASIYIEPNIRGDINSMYEDSYAITQKSRKYGLRTGIYIKF